MISLGVCIGSSNVGTVLLEKEGENLKILRSQSLAHEGNPRLKLKEMVGGELLDSVDKVSFTGKNIKSSLKGSSIAESEAIELAYRYKLEKHGDSNIIVSAGGETFLVYQLDGNGRIIDLYTGNKCASGTGEFFLQQLRRMNLSLEEAVEEVDKENPYKVAGRCSVFCKSDCTHALNKGVSKQRVVAGLCDMMSSKIMELLKRTEYKNVLVIGGVSNNSVVLDFLRDKIDNLTVPDYGDNFEALGVALWALDNETETIKDIDSLYGKDKVSFDKLPSLEEFESKVKFKKMDRGDFVEGDRYIVGLDVGSTTTKAVMISEKDNLILSSSYIRTNGDPVDAARRCYKDLAKDIPEHLEINVVGLGVTGSGRQIAGLHALTPAIINEIVAHARGAVFFDEEVDTIFEIGGQDAKYTYIKNGVPADYAMNEACSAGTGSFLEESAKESLGIDTLEIEGIALKSTSPPNFSDQCSAFISSDIKAAIQEGTKIEDITAGLVYSICTNYLNRVKGSRAVGSKVFMQGGVAYNKAVPIAMAALLGKEIIVPPEPGLVGAFGVALDLKHKLELGILDEMDFDLEELASRDAIYKKEFICQGVKEDCDRKCSISRIKIDGKIYPFGGACNKYADIGDEKVEIDIEELDLVKLREKLVFEDYSVNIGRRIVEPKDKVVGINKSLLVNTLYPLYYNFFHALGYDVIYAEDILDEGIERKGAPFCYPIELAHGSLGALIEKDPDIYFLPHVKSVPVPKSDHSGVTCPFIQGEPYYLKSTFDELKEERLLTPFLDFSKGYDSAKGSFIEIAKDLGISKREALAAFKLALKAQKQFHGECYRIGERYIKTIEENPDEIGVILFGRPYNALSSDGNMGIPHKFASRGYKVIPYDFLPFKNGDFEETMYWSMGQLILKAANFVKDHPQLFASYITNFSCGPDSFLLGYFRDMMNEKPSLTLELDSHTADAGIDTRIEAFIDVVKAYVEVMNKEVDKTRETKVLYAKVKHEGKETYVVDSKGIKYDLRDPKVHLIIPSMGEISSNLFAASFRAKGIRATALKRPEKEELNLGRGVSSCKECLPLLLTAGSLLNYLQKRESEDEILLYFMPETSGPCRFGQYSVMMTDLIKKNKLKDVALLSPSSANGYGGLGIEFILKAWQSVVIADVLEEIKAGIMVVAKDNEEGLKVFEEVCESVTRSVEDDSWSGIKAVLEESAKRLGTIEKSKSIEEAPKVGLIGEIFVRRDKFSRQNLMERLAQDGVILKVSPIAEWIYYCDYIVKNKLVEDVTLKDRVSSYLQGFFKRGYERKIKKIFSQSGLYSSHNIDIDEIVSNGSDMISPKLTGEAILTVGSALTEIIDDVAGIISIGPFGCMPSRISESIIAKELFDRKLDLSKEEGFVKEIMKANQSLPFLSIESDGETFSQLTEAKLETFALQVKRMNKEILKVKKHLNEVG